MVSWMQFAAAEPELADRVRKRFELAKHCTMATIRADGAPRISGVEVEFTDSGTLRTGGMGDALKARDLLRDPRLALHCPTVDGPEDDPAAWVGDAKLAGTATKSAESAGIPGSSYFVVDLTEVTYLSINPEATKMVIETWHPDRGLQRHER